MADFSPECQAARLDYQQATKAYYAARDEHLRATADHGRAVRELGQARQQLNGAEAALLRDNQAWDGQAMAVRNGPALGVANIEAGVVTAPNPPPADVAVATLFHARIEPDFAIYAAGDASALSAWHQIADAALQNNASLRAAAQRSAANAARETAEHAAAAVAEMAARQAEQNAATARSQASATGSAALAEALTACAGQVANHPLGGGGEIDVSPGVLPDDEAVIRDKLDSLPGAETDGLDKVELRDEAEKRDDGQVFGDYLVFGRRIRLFVFGHDVRTLKHEVGHHVFFNRLSEEARARWKRFYNEDTNAQVVPSGKMPTGYAATHEQEGFADVYECYRDGRPLDPEVRQLIEELLQGLS